MEGTLKGKVDQVKILVLDDMVKDLVSVSMIESGFKILQLTSGGIQLRHSALKETQYLSIKWGQDSHHLYLIPSLFSNGFTFVDFSSKTDALFCVDTILYRALILHPNRDAFLHIILRAFQHIIFGLTNNNCTFDVAGCCLAFIELALRSASLTPCLKTVSCLNGDKPGWTLCMDGGNHH